MQMRSTTAIFRLTILILAILSLVPDRAPANTVTIEYEDHGAYDMTQIWAVGHEGNYAVAGAYQLSKTGSTGFGDSWKNGAVTGFCMEPQEPLPMLPTTYAVTAVEDAYITFLGGTVGTTKANYLRELWALHYDSSWTSGGPYTTEQNGLAEVFAASVWEIIYEDLPSSPSGWDVTVDGTLGDGGFQAASLDWETANKWLQNLTGTGAKADLFVFSYDGNQNFLVEVPEPATIALLGLGGLMGLVRRRRRLSPMAG
jgi:hypothetical protein